MRVEVRTCIHCGEEKEIIQKHTFKSNICSQCISNAQKGYNKVRALKNNSYKGVIGRRPYPLRDGYKTTGNFFKAMASKTEKCKTKEEWRELMRERLEYVFENQKLYSWIFFGDDKKPKKKDKIERDFPDTRNMTLQEWEEYERGLDDTETDS